MASIHPLAVVDPRAQLADDVVVGPFTIVHANVRVAAGSRIDSHCELGVGTPLGDGSRLVFGEGTHIRSHSVFYESSMFGPGLITGHHVTVREKTRAGKHFQIGTLSDIQGDCSIGSYVRLHSNVHIGKHSTIDDFAWIFPYVVLTNDPHPPSEVQLGVHVHSYASIATMSVILPGVQVGAHALVAAHACVGRDVPEGVIVAGVPAKVVGATSNIKRRDGSGKPAYPWTLHFHRGYPEQVVERWKQGLHDIPDLD